MNSKQKVTMFLEGVLNSYGQVFFARNRILSIALVLVTFLSFDAGLSGLLAVTFTLTAGLLFGLDRKTLYSGIYGFNSLLVGLGLGLYYAPTPGYFLILFLASLLTLFVAVSLQGVIGKYGLPFLSVPFIVGIWIVLLATRQFEYLGISNKGIFRLNELYQVGGSWLVNLYDALNHWMFPSSLKLYFLSLGAIVFQPNVLAGLFIALGLFFYSRIAFSLSLIGFYTAYLFYLLLGINLAETSYSYIGFNYILTAVAVGGYFLVPSRWSYLWIILLTPIVAILTISFESVFNVFKLPVYALPFNMVVLLFLYVLKFRTGDKLRLREVYIQQFIPERNLYSFDNYLRRFDYQHTFSFRLPFWGKWKITQGHDGDHTHKEGWKHAWDFEITNEEGLTYKNAGDQLTDYYCFDKDVIAPGDGIIEEVIDYIEDNNPGDVNLLQNWGNTVVIKHAENLYSQLSHLKKGSVTVSRGENVRSGEVIGKVGNSGRSPYPHLHVQFQATSAVGSKTLYYPFGQYLIYQDNKPDFTTFSVPLKKQEVSNIDPNELLKQAFHFIPGQQLVFEVEEKDGASRKVTFEVEVDAYNQAWIKNSESGSRASYVSDDLQFYFTSYQGKNSDILYLLFLALYRIPKGYYQTMEVDDSIPLHQVFRPHQRIMQDFLAPFVMYSKATYTLTYKEIDNPVLTKRIVLQGRIRQYRFKREINSIPFTITIESGKIRSISIKHNERISNLSWVD